MYARVYRFLDRLASAAGWGSWLAFLMIFTSGLSPGVWLALALFWWLWNWVPPPRGS